jgi:hypothetical protein
MRHKEHFRTAVYGTPFHARTAPLNVRNEWHRWKDYTTASVYFDEAARIAATWSSVGISRILWPMRFSRGNPVGMLAM